MPPSHSEVQFDGSESHPITLPDDEDTYVPHQYTEVEDLLRPAAQQARVGHPVVDVDDELLDIEYERQIRAYEANYEAIHEDGVQHQEPPRRRGRRGLGASPRNPPLHNTHRRVDFVTAYSIDLKPGKFVELYRPLDVCLMLTIGEESVRSPVGARFIEIKQIWIDRFDGQNVILRGLPYTRNHNLFGRLEKKMNEICQILEVDDDDERSDEEQSLVEITPDKILKSRTLVMTNKLFPRDGHGRFDPAYNTWQKIRELAPLTCRWKMRIEYKDATQRKAGRAYGGSLMRLSEKDVAKIRHRVSDKELREAWRGPTGRSSEDEPTPYTFGDMFCGAGGVSRGAVMAGLKVKLAVDHWPTACQSYRENFSNVELREGCITDFVGDNTINYQRQPIDILHLSPPCQFFSPLAYISSGRNDERNRDILLCCPDLIKKLRPRLFTLEQTFGITHHAHAAFFNALIQGFTCHGYSVQWKIVSFLEYKLPSRRNRFMMIGACPGEQFPPWPPRTFPAVTERQAIGNLRPGTDLHDVEGARKLNNPPRDGNTPLGETICCGGTSKFQHFSGTRVYTLRELACLQGFPKKHRFLGRKTDIRRQIGNAFAPCVSKIFLEHLRMHLERSDRAQPFRGPPQTTPSRPLPGLSSRSPGGRRGMQRNNIRLQLEDYNGDLEEEDAVCLALQKSREALSGAGSPATPSTRHNVRQGFIDLRDGGDVDEVQDSLVGSHIAPLMGRMSLAPPRTPSQARRPRAAQALRPVMGCVPISRPHSATPSSGSRSRSATLDFSPGPPQKRSLDDMHDGAEDHTANEESPEKRERLDSPDGLVSGDEASFKEATQERQKSPTSYEPLDSQDDNVWTF